MVLNPAAVVFLASIATPANARDAQPAPTTTQPSATRPAGPDINTELTAVSWDLNTTGYPDSWPDPITYQEHLDSRAAELIRIAETASDHAMSPKRHLAAANWILARRIEPAASRWFLDIALPDDRKDILTAVHQARRQLAQAREVSQSGDSTTQPANTDKTDRASQNDLETLDAFARAIEAVFAEGDFDADLKENRSVAFRVALLLEDARPAVTSAATLWQAALFNRIDRLDRALELLPRPLAAPSPNGRHFDFYSRLYRCRCIADRGGYAAACALLLQIEERCNEWFTTPRDCTDAERAAALLRTKVLARWFDALDPQAASAERNWCVATVERIHKAACSRNTHCRVMRLGLAVPMLIEAADEPPVESTGATTTQPVATTRPAANEPRP